MQKFTPRINHANWSPTNRRRVARLIKNGLMTEIGLAKCRFDVASCDDKTPAPAAKPNLPIPSHVRKALMASPKAWANLQALAPSYRRQYIGWITSAKKEETQLKRVQEAVALLEKGLKLGDEVMCCSRKRGAQRRPF